MNAQTEHRQQQQQQKQKYKMEKVCNCILYCEGIVFSLPFQAKPGQLYFAVVGDSISQFFHQFENEMVRVPLSH